MAVRAFGGGISATCVLLLGLLGCAGPGVVDVSGDPGIILAMDMKGPRITADEATLAKLVGDVVVPDEYVVVASCFMGHEWKRDAALSDDTVVVSEPGLYRAATLAKSGRFDPRVVWAVEAHLLYEGEPNASELAAEANLDEDEIGEYLRERAVTDSPIDGGIVVVMSANTTYIQRIYFLEPALLPRSRWDQGTRNSHEVHIPGDAGRYLVDDKHCAEQA
jgi:hypothetical protein